MIFYKFKIFNKKIFLDIKNKKIKHQTILFSPAAASFDSFKNFEERGKYFNNLIKKFIMLSIIQFINFIMVVEKY